VTTYTSYAECKTILPAAPVIKVTLRLWNELVYILMVLYCLASYLTFAESTLSQNSKACQTYWSFNTWWFIV